MNKTTSANVYYSLRGDATHFDSNVMILELPKMVNKLIHQNNIVKIRNLRNGDSCRCI
jgi:hypothetical protein